VRSKARAGSLRWDEGQRIGEQATAHAVPCCTFFALGKQINVRKYSEGRVLEIQRDGKKR
jgi:hypothetical protein